MQTLRGRARVSATLPSLRLLLWLLLTLLVQPGCTHPPAQDLEQRVEVTRKQMEAQGMGDDAAVEARVAEFEAALAREAGAPLVDEVELRTAGVYDTDYRIEMLLRVPFENPLEVKRRKLALRASTKLAVARLEEVALDRRVALCVPSVRRQAREEHAAIYAAYAGRQRELIAWNDDLHAAGLQNELDATRFALDSELNLQRRSPGPVFPLSVVLPVLPPVTADAAPLDQAPAVMRKTVMNHNPSADVQSALQERYEALAQREKARRIPSLKFVDVGFEPRPKQGQAREYGARVAFEIPFGIKPKAEASRYRAMARSAASDQRHLVDERVEESQAALIVIADFESRSEGWLALLALADTAEGVADRWRKSRVARPRQVSGLLDNVYRARSTVLDARERAGFAGCTLMAMSGLSIQEWPRH
jgi:hypothetical protein